MHAHPDDETLTCGVTIAHHVALGDEVTVLTCTLGEEGEVIPPELHHLEGHPDDLLGAYRHGELVLAMARIGARLRVLGADPARGRLSRYRDSGMAGSAAADRPEAFARCDPQEPAALVAAVLRELRPDAVVTYDVHGGYGHPDHIATHRVTRAALALLTQDELPARTFEILTPRSWAEADRAWLRAHRPAAYGLRVPGADEPYPPSVVSDELVTHVVEDAAARAVKNDALRAHRTQVIVVSEDVHALSNRIAARTGSREGFRRVEPRTWRTVPATQPATVPAPARWRDGLFA
ncbi:MAG TPA: N-acetyl-1-D-myo-inositol-2-amino-2-deoxy-alpha-D-glucopyranoside deacetylase [Intrasporangium sp.]|uniref:N-acetyl-1-D-myo-inositol-2-amino-2-deoxy-alpha- D-glucopyranoside deacetylase n=1 Tax=Intrasporangium sp. TaxID=1925024 RepID=UPI002D76C31C|nr:N-acetyl-1-D-myo-inositol-2-amino-2-deoxy-alpha-D-glucopyranoside deacetylase [Intrasporangium sp.]HET7397640.1 N-acetyl-1-D-myo-inositol-2-amino-2-deoxy-alpha-D-glucopyranoside deacetylase [Intrasporangium sp.]